MLDAEESEAAAGAAGGAALLRTEMDSGSKEREIRERRVGGWKQDEEEGVCVSLRREKERVVEEWIRERRGGRALAARTKGD